MTRQTVIGTVMLKGRIHTSLLHMKIDANDTKCVDAQILHFSSTGHINDREPLSEDYYQVPLTLFSKVEFELAEDRLQKTYTGCTLFSLYFYETLMNFDRLMAFNNQYTYAGASNAIFLYAKDHHTREFEPNVHRFSMPVAMTVGKQHYDGSFAIRGLDQQHEALRQQEFDKPADLASMKTANEIFQEVSVDHRHDVKRNLKIQQMRYDVGYRISQKLSFFAQRRVEIEAQYAGVKRRY